MKSKLLKYLSFIPSTIVVLSLIFFYGRKFLAIETKPVEGSVAQGLLTLLLIVILISLFLVISLMIVYIFHLVVYNKKMSFYQKLIWLFALWFLNMLVLPIYYLKYMQKKPTETIEKSYDE